jgi:UDP-N-acetylmuramyl pentapeptide phosphotransferase/UDP-N-acetylglucosamine-1-phosphate transferase
MSAPHYKVRNRPPAVRTAGDLSGWGRVRHDAIASARKPGVSALFRSIMMLSFMAILAAASLLGGLLYRRLWTNLKGTDQTPTGYGGLLAIFLLAGAVYLRTPADLIWSYALVAIAAVIYWCDDVLGLSRRHRVAIQFVSGVAVCYLLLAGTGPGAPVLTGCCLAAGLLNVVLTQAVNFSDGADLNVAGVMLLTAATILLIGPDAAFMRPSAIIILAFVLPFALLNWRPRTIYFGDAGCFVFASFLTTMTVYYFRNGADAAAFAAIPLALPVYDAVYVVLWRIRNKEDILSRNWLHLYQMLQIKYRNFSYLVPQPLNIVLVAAVALILQRLGLSALFAVTVAMLLVTPLFHAIYRKLLL